MYLINCKGLDIANSINKLSQFTSNPNNEHWSTLVKVLRYLERTWEYSLHYEKYPLVLEGYSDANWILDTVLSKSSSGYVFTLRGGAIYWKSPKQTCIAWSTIEFEFILLDKIE